MPKSFMLAGNGIVTRDLIYEKEKKPRHHSSNNPQNLIGLFFRDFIYKKCILYWIKITFVGRCIRTAVVVVPLTRHHIRTRSNVCHRHAMLRGVHFSSLMNSVFAFTQMLYVVWCGENEECDIIIRTSKKRTFMVETLFLVEENNAVRRDLWSLQTAVAEIFGNSSAILMTRLLPLQRMLH